MGHLWQETARARDDYPALDRDLEVDVAVVGGGITGVTCALALRRAGAKVALVEAERLAGGTTGHTSAHLTVMQDRSYVDLARRFGATGARRTLAASAAAIDAIEGFSRELDLDCGFARVPGYLYTTSEREVPGLEREAALLRRLGCPSRIVAGVPPLLAEDGGPSSSAWALEVPDQAVFHPVRYVEGLAAALVREGGVVCERTRVITWRDGPPCRLGTTTGHAIGAREVVLATHSPIGLLLDVHGRIAPYISYLIVARTARPMPPALVWDTAEPYHYVRPFEAEGGDRVLVGGADHKTGHADDAAARYARLEEYARSVLPVVEVEHRWSHEFFEPADGLPLVGRLPGRNAIHVATGFSGTGLTFGTAAALGLARTLGGSRDPWLEVVTPRRVKLVAGAARVLSHNADVARCWVGDRLGVAEGDPEALLAGQGEVMAYGGERVAACRDRDGRLHVLSPVCTHAGCLVRWNSERVGWDCPCHGGRYDASGHVVYGPPTRDLDRRPLPHAARPGRRPSRVSAPRPAAEERQGRS